jgi:beta-galactosidase/beta-glucuronidase
MSKIMKRNLIIVILFCCNFSSLMAQGSEPVGEKIKTDWAGKVDLQNVLPEYPRPQMVRENWKNLNGLWQYAIVAKEAIQPEDFQGEILVPFAAESALSGIQKSVGKENNLWYKTTFAVPSSMKKKTLLLHFGAVDWETEVFVNGKSVGKHQGGYDPFSFDITSSLAKNKTHEIVVKVWDPTDEGPQARGKQINNPRGIWYTPVTGIWQTVWIEAVPNTYVKGIKNTPNIHENTITVKANVANAQAGDQIKVSVWENGTSIAEETVDANTETSLKIANPKLWSPDSPSLYDLKVAVIRKGKEIDAIDSYFAMREISKKADANGVQRMMLNGKFVFQYGPLDQGWWPDGLYTAPSDEALKYDIVKTKEMGFNMIRKHVKVEPARWYRHCDELGMLVWQDMPSGDLGARWGRHPGIIGRGRDMERSPESERIYRMEWKEIMDALYNFPSIVVWVPFNEAWGQFKTKEIIEWTEGMDPTRLVNEASGGNFHFSGDIIDLHNYPDPAMPRPEIFGAKQVIVLGEFGGLGWPVTGHLWQEKDNWGYRNFKSADELKVRYEQLMKDLLPLISKGLSAAVYTQTTDVEGEVNGLMTYDRKIMKMPESFLKKLHDQLYDVKVEW